MNETLIKKLFEKLISDAIGSVIQTRFGTEFKISIKEDETGYDVLFRLDKKHVDDFVLNNFGKTLITINKKRGK